MEGGLNDIYVCKGLNNEIKNYATKNIGYICEEYVCKNSVNPRDPRGLPDF